MMLRTSRDKRVSATTGFLLTKLTWRTDEKLDERRRKILEWLSSDDFEETHEMHFKKRFRSTGQWLLNDSRFISWRDEGQSRLLWCSGARKLLVLTR